LSHWRAHFGDSSHLHIERKELRVTSGPVDQLDIVVLTTADRHLLDATMTKRFSVRQVDVRLDDDRMLPFAAQAVMADSRSRYDWFVYSEDDLRVADAGFFLKLSLFQSEFGWRRLMQPNRYEMNERAFRLKTYVDEDLKAGLTAPYFASIPDDDYLQLTLGGQPVSLRRALNPHSGFFALSAEQLDYWIRQPHFGDRDCSFVSPLESAATLGILKTFSIYKPFGPWSGFLEVEHLDNRFSGMKLRTVT
jgi:hypothetical protein